MLSREERGSLLSRNSGVDLPNYTASMRTNKLGVLSAKGKDIGLGALVYVGAVINSGSVWYGDCTVREVAFRQKFQCNVFSAADCSYLYGRGKPLKCWRGVCDLKYGFTEAMLFLKRMNKRIKWLWEYETYTNRLLPVPGSSSIPTERWTLSTPTQGNTAGGQI